MVVMGSVALNVVFVELSLVFKLVNNIDQLSCSLLKSIVKVALVCPCASILYHFSLSKDLASYKLTIVVVAVGVSELSFS